MRSAKMLLVLLIVGISALVVSAPTFAGTVLFADDFEGGTVGAYPTATIGTWNSDTGTDQSQIFVTNGATPGPAPGGSTQYLRLARAATWNQVDANFTMQTNPSDLVRMEADVWGGNCMPSVYAGVDQYLGSGFVNGLYLQFRANGSIYGPPGALANMTWPVGQWNHVVLDYHPTAATFDLTVNAQTMTGIAMLTPCNVDDLMLTEVSGPEATYWDNVKITLNPSAVPEPSSIALVVTGLMGFLAYAWRKRR
jgi:hypothetical protein